MDGQLTDQAREAFCDMRIEEFPAGAALVGDVIDESHLLGIMAQCRSLGLVVVSAHRVSPPAPRDRRPRSGRAVGGPFDPGRGGPRVPAARRPPTGPGVDRRDASCVGDRSPAGQRGGG